MKKILLTLLFIGLIITACGQAPSQTFNKIIVATKGVQFGDGTIQLTAAIGTGSSTVEWANVLNKPLTFAPATHNHDALYRPITWFPTFAQVTAKPTTLAGYGITDADGSIINEIQALSISGTTLSLSLGGGSVILPSSGGGDNWGTQTVVTNTSITGAGTTANPLGVANTVIAPLWVNITGKPTTLVGYGITDAALATHNHASLYKPLSYIPTWNEITLKPTFATVATTGSYTDLINKPETEDLSVAIKSYNGDIESYTTIQINALVPTGVKIVHDSTLNTLKVYIGGVWRTIILSE